MRYLLGFLCLMAACVSPMAGCGSDGPKLLPPPECKGLDLRREAFFEATIKADAKNTYSEIMRVEKGVMPDEPKIQYDLELAG